VVWLGSNNNSQRLGPGSRHQATAEPKGEFHQTFVGQVTHYVTERLNFYKVSGPTSNHQAAVDELPLSDIDRRQVANKLLSAAGLGSRSNKQECPP